MGWGCYKFIINSDNVDGGDGVAPGRRPRLRQLISSLTPPPLTHPTRDSALTQVCSSYA